MNSWLYRCGWCGNVTDANGKLPEGYNRQKAINMLEKYNPTNHVAQVHGECCPVGDAELDPSRGMVQITRDMAIDAGDLRLEGQWIKW